MGPLAAMRRRHLADLAGDQLQPAAVEGAAQRHRHRRIAVPAQLEDGRLVASAGQRGREPGGAGAGMDDKPAVGGRAIRCGELQAERRSDPARAGSMSTSVTSADFELRAEKSGQCADHARTHHGDPPEGTGARHPRRRSTRSPCWRPAPRAPPARRRGTGNRRCGRHVEHASDADAARTPCVRATPPARSRPCRPSRSRTSPGTGKSPAMNGARMRSNSDGGTRPCGDQRLGASADRAMAGAHPHVRRRPAVPSARRGFPPGPRRHTRALTPVSAAVAHRLKAI